MDWSLIAVLAGVTALLAAYTWWDARRRRAALRRRIVRSFGGVPEDGGPRALTDAWWRRLAACAGPADVDERTWQDLDMDALFARLNVCQSAVGEGYLYATLHRPLAPEETARRRALAQALANHEEARVAAQLALAGTGRKRGGDFSRLLFSPQFAVLKAPALYLICSLLPLFCLAALGQPWGVPALVGAVCLNVLLCQRAKAKTAAWLDTLAYLSDVLRAGHGVCKALRPAAPELCGKVREALEALSGAAGPLSRLVRTGQAGAEAAGADFFADVLNLVFLLPVLYYQRAVRALAAQPAALEQLFCLLGEVELAVCAASFAAGQAGPVCAPDFLPENRLEAQEMRHPLLPRAVPNSGAFGRCVLFTGSNASGKSTFLKALALNALLAQTLGLCTARRFALKAGPLPVLSSMAIADDLLAGESYFVAELRSLRRVLQRADAGEEFLCFVDEILRGTNTDERLAASQAVLRHLAGTGALCFVATHDAELTAALADVCGNYHFREVVQSGAVAFDYRLRPGPARGRNAIRLLGEMGFPPAVVAEARRLAPPPLS